MREREREERAYPPAARGSPPRFQKADTLSFSRPHARPAPPSPPTQTHHVDRLVQIPGRHLPGIVLDGVRLVGDGLEGGHLAGEDAGLVLGGGGGGGQGQGGGGDGDDLRSVGGWGYGEV